MNAHSHSFPRCLEAVAQRISDILRSQSGLDANSRVVQTPEKTIIVFDTNDTDTRTLRKFLRLEMNEAASRGCWKQACVVDIEDIPDTNQRGAVAVVLNPELVSCIVSKFEQNAWNP